MCLWGWFTSLGGVVHRRVIRVVFTLAGMAALRAVHSTNGRWDVIVEIGTKTLEEFDEVLARIRKLDGVVASETSLLLKTRKAGQAAP